MEEVEQVLADHLILVLVEAEQLTLAVEEVVHIIARVPLDQVVAE